MYLIGKVSSFAYSFWLQHGIIRVDIKTIQLLSGRWHS